MSKLTTIIENTEDVWLEIKEGAVACRQCALHPDGSIARADFPSYLSRCPEELFKHMAAHAKRKHAFSQKFATLEFWSSLLASAKGV